ncbi:hypothetical protein A9Q88_05175 [Gammaproteobacteria bacterium 50_400_T64]|nr:hypothetical protein A9Q88_05175 [Gammaproteobacteria bacterium 50_400_T64]
MYIFHISRTNLDTTLLLVVFLIISFYTSESSADYPSAQIKNNTEYTVSGTVHYVSELCKNDSYSVGPGQTWKGSRRGVCLIGKIEGRIMLANQKGYNVGTRKFDIPLPFNPKYQPVSLGNTNKSTYGEKTDVSEYLSDPATSYSKFQINAFGDRYRIFSDAEWAKASNTGQGKSPGFRFINKTAWPVAVSFDQVGCLYYGIVPAQFNGKPGEFRRDTGAVWFTIQAHIQPDGINPQTDWDCIKPVAELVGEVALAGMTGGSSVAASGARIAAKAAVKAAVKKGLKSVAKFGANELGEYLTDSSSIKMVGQYAGYPWPAQCNQMPEYHITGGPVPSHDEQGEFYLEDGRPLKITKVNTCGNDMMMASSKSETAEPVNISNYFNDSTPTTSKPPRASQPPSQRLLNTDIHNFNGMPFGSIDATYDDGNGGVVMFSSRAYARYNLAQKKFIGGTASLSNFTGMPFTRVDAAFNDSNGGIVMFSGGTYARYNLAQQKFIGGTASLNNFTGMPFTTIDAAFNDGNGGIVMFSGGRYARYNLAQKKFIGGTASLSNFTGMPFTRVDASFPDRNTYKNTKIIMINKSVYQRYDIRHAQFENARTKLLDKKQLEARAKLDTQARLDAQAKLDEQARANEQNRLNQTNPVKYNSSAEAYNIYLVSEDGEYCLTSTQSSSGINTIDVQPFNKQAPDSPQCLTWNIKKSKMSSDDYNIVTSDSFYLLASDGTLHFVESNPWWNNWSIRRPDKKGRFDIVSSRQLKSDRYRLGITKDGNVSFIQESRSNLSFIFSQGPQHHHPLGSMASQPYETNRHSHQADNDRYNENVSDFDNFVAKARHGDAETQYQLAKMYYKGIDVKHNMERAFDWYLRAAEQDHELAQGQVGYMYFKGQGVGQSYSTALVWLERAALKGHINSQFNLAGLYFYGNGTTVDYPSAFKWYLKAAEQGHNMAQEQTAVMLGKGLGIERNYKDAIFWHKKLLAQYAVPDSMFAIGYAYNTGGAGVTQDYLAAARWYEKAAQANHVIAQRNLGILYQKGLGVGKNPQRAFNFYMKAAQQGNSDAQVNVGAYFDYIDGAVSKDFEQGFMWYMKSAQQGNATGQFMVASMYSLGEGVDKDISQAITWYRKASAQGHVSAQEKLDELLKEN